LYFVVCTLFFITLHEIHSTCRSTASRSPVLTLGAIYVPPTVNYLQYFATGSTLTAVGPFQLQAPWSGTLSRISFGTRPSVQTVSDVCVKRICLLDTNAFSALEVLDDNRAIQIYLHTNHNPTVYQNVLYTRSFVPVAPTQRTRRDQ